VTVNIEEGVRQACCCNVAVHRSTRLAFALMVVSRAKNRGNGIKLFILPACGWPSGGDVRSGSWLSGLWLLIVRSWVILHYDVISSQTSGEGCRGETGLMHRFTVPLHCISPSDYHCIVLFLAHSLQLPPCIQVSSRTPSHNMSANSASPSPVPRSATVSPSAGAEGYLLLTIQHAQVKQVSFAQPAQCST